MRYAELREGKPAKKSSWRVCKLSWFSTSEKWMREEGHILETLQSGE